jgi:hypothetical protein
MGISNFNYFEHCRQHGSTLSLEKKPKILFAINIRYDLFTLWQTKFICGRRCSSTGDDLKKTQFSSLKCLFDFFIDFQFAYLE